MLSPTPKAAARSSSSILKNCSAHYSRKPTTNIPTHRELYRSWVGTRNLGLKQRSSTATTTSRLAGEIDMTAAMPRVSVVMPTYSRGHVIKETIQSLLEQTFQDFELLVRD